MMQQRAVKALGEIALRVKDLDSMQWFYEEVIGLEVMKRFPHDVFFKIAEGYGGHTQILALFDRTQEAGYRGVEPEKSTLHHFAFTISLTDFDGERLCRDTVAAHFLMDRRTMMGTRSAGTRQYYDGRLV